MCSKRHLSLPAAAVAAAACVSVGAAQRPIARTPCTDYEGLAESFNGVNVSAYRGIRYAPEPTRWAPPLPYSNCTPGSVTTAHEFGPICVQDSALGGVGVEDCLSLNVFTPASATPLSNLPVLIFIHGGDLTIGSSNWYNMTPAVALFATGADTGPVVIVTINYRLNVVGFLSTPDLCAVSNGEGCSNFGILDQRLAFSWVRDHIYAFGGDASRVTISGQSSGGTSVFAHLTSSASRGLFSAAISLSGSANLTMGKAQKFAQDGPFFAQFGCDKQATPADRVACMRSQRAGMLGNATPAGWGAFVG